MFSSRPRAAGYRGCRQIGQFDGNRQIRKVKTATAIALRAAIGRVDIPRGAHKSQCCPGAGERDNRRRVLTACKRPQQVHMFPTSRLISAAFVFAICVGAGCIVAPLAATSDINSIHLSGDIVPAPDGFEPVAGKYIAAKATDVYISPFIWAGKVIGLHLTPGQPVEVLARLKGYDWLLIGNKGEGIGYVPIATLSPAK